MFGCNGSATVARAGRRWNEADGGLPPCCGYTAASMRLEQVIPGTPRGARDLEISDLAYDAGAVRPGTLFFCVPGFTRDGHDFAPEAIARGAVALAVQRPLNLNVPEITVLNLDDPYGAHLAAVDGGR